jgi:hypothetical protein
MNCPKCNVLLQISERQGIEIDCCPQCRGVWLDRESSTKLLSVPPCAYPLRILDTPIIRMITITMMNTPGMDTTNITITGNEVSIGLI